MEKVKIKKASDNSILPKRATDGSAAFDIFVQEGMFIEEGKRTIVPAGFSIELPKGYYAEIRPRSGYSAKGFASSENGRYNADVIHGLIDPDYRAEVGVIIHNNDNTFYIDRGQRIAQMLICKYEDVALEEADELTKTERQNGGFGSTGV